MTNVFSAPSDMTYPPAFFLFFRWAVAQSLRNNFSSSSFSCLGTIRLNACAAFRFLQEQVTPSGNMSDSSRSNDGIKAVVSVVRGEEKLVARVKLDSCALSSLLGGQVLFCGMKDSQAIFCVN